MSVGAAYDAAAQAWATGPARVYGRLAGALLDQSPVQVAGATVLDVGAGTGVAAQAARERGAAVAVAADLAAGMLAHRGPGIDAVVTDATRLPFQPGSFDLVLSAFCLSHLDDPVAAVVEASRVGRAFLASAFAPGGDHPAKSVVDDVMASFGFRPPRWYLDLKTAGGARVEDPDALAALATRVGYGSVAVVFREVDSGLDSPADVVDWRWGMAHLAPFVSALPVRDRAKAREACEAAVADLPAVRIGMLALSAS